MTHRVLGGCRASSRRAAATLTAQPPNLTNAAAGFKRTSVFRERCAGTAMQLAPGGHLSGRGLNIKPSDNEKMLIALGEDPYVIKRTRVDATYGLVTLMDEAWKAAPQVTRPTLVLYADDDEVVPSGPIVDAAHAMPGLKRLIGYKDGYHMLLRDLGAAKVWDEIAAEVLPPTR